MSTLLRETVLEVLATCLDDINSVEHSGIVTASEPVLFYFITQPCCKQCYKNSYTQIITGFVQEVSVIQEVSPCYSTASN